MDNLSKEQRIKNMKAIKNKDSKCECLLRKALWKKGLRYRKNYSKIIGKPDIVFIRKKVAIFCDGEFWHGYNIEKKENITKSNQEYWSKKIIKNIERDKKVNQQLKNNGWTVIRFWEKEIYKNLDYCVGEIMKVLQYKN